MAIELVTKYLPYVDEIFKNESKTSMLTNQDFSWSGASTVKVYKITTAEMNDYARSCIGSNFYGTPQPLNATTEAMTIFKDRSFTFIIDALDEDETGNTLESASALARQQREVIIPEVDTYVYGVMVSKAGTKPTAVELTEDNIYDEIIKGTTLLDDAEIPEVGRVLTVTPSVYELMKKDERIVLQTNVGQEMRVKGVVAIIDGMEVIKVPSVRLAENFGFMIAHPSATVAPVKLQDYNTHINPPGINGTLTEGRIVYDAFVLENKAKAIYYQELSDSTEDDTSGEDDALSDEDSDSDL